MVSISSLTEHEDNHEVLPVAPSWIVVRVSRCPPLPLTPASPKTHLHKQLDLGLLGGVLPTVHPSSVGRDRWPHTLVVSRSVPCRALTGEGFQRAGDLGLSVALLCRGLELTLSFLLKKGGAMGCAPGQGRKLQGLSDVTQHGSIWSHLESISPTQALLQCLQAVGWHPLHFWCPQPCCYLFPAGSRGLQRKCLACYSSCCPSPGPLPLSHPHAGVQCPRASLSIWGERG